MRIVHRCFAVLCVALSLTVVAPAADTPLVARVGHLEGKAEFAPAASERWYRVVANRPLTAGDRLRLARGRAEIRFAGGVAQLEGPARLDLPSEQGDATRLRLERGKLHVRWREGRLSVDSPNLRLVVVRPGELRVDVDQAAAGTAIAVTRAEATAYGVARGRRTLHSGEHACLGGDDLSPLPDCRSPRGDEFDRWLAERARLRDGAQAQRYVFRRVIGGEDLDAYGEWRGLPGYGPVWVPRPDDPGWAPFSVGDWEWIEGWGWTWVGAEPWSFATHHYGRWLQFDEFWGWQPDADDAASVFRPERLAAVRSTPVGSEPAPAPPSIVRAPPAAQPIPPAAAPVPPADAPLTIAVAARPIVVVGFKPRHRHRRRGDHFHRDHLAHDRHRQLTVGFGLPGRAMELQRAPVLRRIAPMEPALVPPRRPVSSRFSSLETPGRSARPAIPGRPFIDGARFDSRRHDHGHHRHQTGGRGSPNVEDSRHAGRHLPPSRSQRRTIPQGRWQGRGRMSVIRWRR